MNSLRGVCRKIPKTLISFKSYNKIFSRNHANVECNIDVEKTFIPPPFLKLPPKTSERKKQFYDFFLVLDFEATCDSPANVIPQEIIEFPVLKVNSQTYEIESVFHSYVRPIVNPELSKFCTQLTGIAQEQIDSQPVFEDVFENFQRWLEKENLLSGAKFACASCGDWDLRFIFPSQCKAFRIPVPDYMKSWINVKVSFAELSQVYPRNMVTMMKYCQLKHQGKLHSGLDDCKNIARIMTDLADRGILFECNGQTQ